jgi:hypothetical protein
MVGESEPGAVVTRDHVRAGVVLGLVAVAVYLWHPDPGTAEELDDPLFQPF